MPIIVYLDAAKGITLSSGRVSGWTDQATPSRSWSQATADNQPNWAAIHSSNGKPAVIFDGTALNPRYLDPNSTISPASAMMFVAARLTADPPVAGVGGFWSFGSSVDASHVPFTDGNIYDDWGSTVRHAIGNPSASLASNFIYSSR
ncbi:MAG: hypothetical protein MN733_32525, partial [Nitrososphaera sp.]|nr:hypothetical protein [Nitrososphaera sp.]